MKLVGPVVTKECSSVPPPALAILAEASKRSLGCAIIPFMADAV
jgi:hypothetical protein